MIVTVDLSGFQVHIPSLKDEGKRIVAGTELTLMGPRAIVYYGSDIKGTPVRIADYSQINVALSINGYSSSDTLTVSVEQNYDINNPDTWTILTQFTYTNGTFITDIVQHKTLTTGDAAGLGPYIRVTAHMDGLLGAGKVITVYAVARE